MAPSTRWTAPSQPDEGSLLKPIDPLPKGDDDLSRARRGQANNCNQMLKELSDPRCQ